MPFLWFLLIVPTDAFSPVRKPYQGVRRTGSRLPHVYAASTGEGRQNVSTLLFSKAVDDEVQDIISPPSGSSIFESFSDDIIPIMHNPETTLIGSDAIVASSGQPEWMENILKNYWGPRILLAVVAAIYGTNFALGALMNEALPASAVTASRMTLAATALAPFVRQIRPSLRNRAILTGCFTAMGYVAQSVALTDTDPARVSFLGAATVLWLPFLEFAVDKTPMGWKDAPQTWIAALLCLMGVGVLELYDLSGGAGALVTGVGTGDLLALLQAVGFGTGCFLSAKMVREEPDQVLPVTSVLIATTAVLSWLWCAVDHSAGPLMRLFSDPSLHPVVLAVLWTGLISTSLNFLAEIAALGHVPPSEASVLLASEPVWAALFAAGLLGETLGLNDYVGGAFIITACLVNAVLKPSDIHRFFRRTEKEL